MINPYFMVVECSHLFQRVASFLHSQLRNKEWGLQAAFSSLSESGFIPTARQHGGHISFIFYVLISFREWLHSYKSTDFGAIISCLAEFSSLSESGFIPTPAKK